MVKNENDKVNNNNNNYNYIHIVNDLKDLGLLQRKRRASSSVSGATQSKQQAKPQISGIEKTIIDNSPQLRRDVQQLANERSLLADRVMENENRFNFLHRTINENPFRFIQQQQGPQRNLSDVQGDSLYLPSMSQLYNTDTELKNDGIDTSIVDASNNFKPHMNAMPDDEQTNLEPIQQIPVADVLPNRPVESFSIQPVLTSPTPSKTTEALASMASNDNNDVSVQKPKQLNFNSSIQDEGDTLIKRIDRLQALGKPKENPVRNTSPKPTPRKETPLEYLASPNTIKKRETWLKGAPPADVEFAKSLFGDELNLKIPAVRNIIEAQKSLEKETKGEEEKEPEVKKISSAQRKAILAKERKQQDAELAELKANENASLAQVSKERALADAKTNNLIDANFNKYGGRNYVLANAKKDLDTIEKLATDNSTFVLNKDTNEELMEKYYGYLRLSGSIQKFAGRGYSSTTLLFNIPRIKESLSKTLHMPDLWKARKPVENRSSSVPIQRSTGIHTLNDIVSASSGNAKA